MCLISKAKEFFNPFQEDGTWTDIPRCIEHDPGVDQQIPGTCPSIPGYCAQGFLNTRCKFDCVQGQVSDVTGNITAKIVIVNVFCLIWFSSMHYKTMQWYHGLIDN